MRAFIFWFSLIIVAELFFVCLNVKWFLNASFYLPTYGKVLTVILASFLTPWSVYLSFFVLTKMTKMIKLVSF